MRWLSFEADGKSIVAGSYKEGVRVWEAASLEEIDAGR